MKLENINSELELLEIDYSKQKLFLVTNKVKNEKEFCERAFLIKNLSALSNKFSTEELLTRMVLRIGYLSLVKFIFFLTSKESSKSQKQEFLPLLKSSSKEVLVEISEKKNEEYLSMCCHLCQKGFQELKGRGNKEVIHDVSSFCPNSKCINSGFVEK